MDAVPKDGAIASLKDRFTFDSAVQVTRPTLPSLEAYTASLAQIWESGWLTNAGQFHTQFEEALSDRLGVEHLSLFCNGTQALLVALQSLRALQRSHGMMDSGWSRLLDDLGLNDKALLTG